MKYLIIRDTSKFFEEMTFKNILLNVVIHNNQTIKIWKHLCDNVSYNMLQIFIVVNFLHIVVKTCRSTNKEKK